MSMEKVSVMQHLEMRAKKIFRYLQVYYLSGVVKDFLQKEMIAKRATCGPFFRHGSRLPVMASLARRELHLLTEKVIWVEPHFSTMRKTWLVLVLVTLALSSSCSPVPAQTFYLSIWVDKGCGGQYFVGEMLTVYWQASHPCTIEFWEIEPNGNKRILENEAVWTAGKGSLGWTLKDYGYGKRAIYAEGTSIWGHASAQCDYLVLKKAADIQVKVTDQDKEPIPGAEVLLDGTLVASTDSSGMCTISEVGFGEHTVTVKYAGEEKTNRIQIASTQKQFTEFVFSVVKRGTIQVRVTNQNGEPVKDADVYVDGVKEGKTSSEGTLTVSASEGGHAVEAKWRDAEAQKAVTVVRNQTSFVDLTLTIEVSSTLTVFVRDDSGNAVVDAGVYLDNAPLGKTDARGRLDGGEVTPGSHMVRAEKQGYVSGTQNVDVKEGDNSVTVVVTKEEAAAYGILAVLGLLYVMKRRRT